MKSFCIKVDSEVQKNFLIVMNWKIKKLFIKLLNLPVVQCLEFICLKIC